MQPNTLLNCFVEKFITKKKNNMRSAHFVFCIGKEFGDTTPGLEIKLVKEQPTNGFANHDLAKGFLEFS